MNSRNRGFGLVEIMVGLVIGLVVMLVIMQVATVFEGQKRATTSGGDAQTSAAMALFLMEREVRGAGNGMSEGEPQKYPPLTGCTTRIFDAAAYLVPNAAPATPSTIAPAGTVSNVRLAPVIASDGGGGLSDSLTIAYGTSSITAPFVLMSSYAPGSGSINLVSASGIAANDMVALVEEDKAATAALNLGANYKGVRPCSILRVTGAPGVPTPGTVPVPVADLNGLAFNDDSRLYNLGQFNLVTYRIDVATQNLVADVSKFGIIPNGGAGTPVVNRTDFSPLASNIVNMQVQYGVDNANPMGTIQANCKTPMPGAQVTAADADAVVDTWENPTGVWANDNATTPSLIALRQIRAVRIGLVARTGVMEVAVPPAVCSSTTVAPTISWDNGPAMPVDLSGIPNWQCYRYRVFQTVIPVRNALWSSTMNPASSASCGLRDPA